MSRRPLKFNAMVNVEAGEQGNPTKVLVSILIYTERGNSRMYHLSNA